MILLHLAVELCRYINFIFLRKSQDGVENVHHLVTYGFSGFWAPKKIFHFLLALEPELNQKLGRFRNDPDRQVFGVVIVVPIAVIAEFADSVF